MICTLRAPKQPLRSSVREDRSAPLPGQPLLDRADAATRTDAGMLSLHVLLLESDAEETSYEYSDAAGIYI